MRELHSIFWPGKRVIVTGGAGFIGSHVVEDLFGAGARVTVFDDLRRGTIRNLGHLPLYDSTGARLTGEDCYPGDRWPVILCREPIECGFIEDRFAGVDVVIHMAARVSNVAHNTVNHAGMYRDNMASFLPVFDACVEARVPMLALSSTICIYGDKVDVPTPENQGFLGSPEPSNAGYGEAKRDMERLMRWAALEGKLRKIAVARFSNAYGPRDYYDSGSSHVVAALMRKCYNLGDDEPLVVWGSGKQTRSLTFVKDIARSFLLLVESRALRPELDTHSVNISSPDEVSIADLAEAIVREFGYGTASNSIKFDTDMPEGSARRAYLLVRLAEIDAIPDTKLADGIRETIQDFRIQAKYYTRIKPWLEKTRGHHAIEG